MSTGRPEITIVTHDGHCGPSCDKQGYPVKYIRADLADRPPFSVRALAALPGAALSVLFGYGLAKGWWA